MSDLGAVRYELLTWADLGLIPHFDDDTMQDVVLTSVLKVVREHIVGMQQEVKGAEMAALRQEQERIALPKWWGDLP